jgi:GntR family transcriptional regulator of vanillate catabolism
MTERTARSDNQTTRALLELREMILRGDIESGERISEQSVVESIGVSRTPVRMALVKLAEEGLLDPIPSGGYAVRSFSLRDIFDAIEVRGTLEGLGARRAAERGLSPSEIEPLKVLLAELDDVVAAPTDDATFARYADLNAEFHEMARDLSGSDTIVRQIDRANAYPFAAHSALVMAQSRLPEAQLVLTLAQEHHRTIVEAMIERQGGRAEATMREHALLAGRNLRWFLRDRRSLEQMPGSALISSAP